jgi:hypothetical protein
MEAVGRGLAAAVVPALLSAAITRVLMRLVALLVGNEPHFDPFALLGIFVVYAVLLAPGCLALALSGSRWPWLLFGAGWVVLLFEGVAIGLDETSSAQDLSPMRWVGLSLVLLVMAAVYAGQGILAANWARHGVPWRRGRTWSASGAARPTV